MAKYTIGVDFGSLSCRSVIACVETGEEIAAAVYAYPHAVMDAALPCGKRLGPDWALQHPADYETGLYQTISEAITASGVSADDIIGVGVDFTTCTILPLDENGRPLCERAEYESEPHAYVKMWKHHAAEPQTERFNRIAAERGETFLSDYGGKASAEWFMPKVMQILDEKPEIYDAAYTFSEAADWVTFLLCGERTINEPMLGYKCFYQKEKGGFPSKEFMAALHPKMATFTEDKLKGRILPLGAKAGEITAEAAAKTGLNKGTAVCVAAIDAHAGVPPIGKPETGAMLAIIGTSTCDILLSETAKSVDGICGVVPDGAIPGYYGYEAGQSCVGDHFDWFVKNCVPSSYEAAAKAKGVSVHQYLTEKAQELAIGESGLVALDWWNGNRSVLADYSLSGVMVGMTLATKPEEMYRALIEATAYGMRVIVENFEDNGVPVSKIYATGGIANKNAMLMQIYADVTRKPCRIVRSAAGPGLGMAIFAAAAAGSKNGGYDTVSEACERMGGCSEVVYTPNEDNAKRYDALYAVYRELHDRYGKENKLLKTLRSIRNGARA